MRGQHLARDIGGEPEHEEIDRDARDDLVDAVRDHEEGEEEAEEPADADRGDEPADIADQRADDGAREGAGEKHPLDADIDHRHALAKHAGEAAERDRDGAHQRRLQHAGQREGFAGGRPDEERRHHQEEADAEEERRPARAAAHEEPGAEEGEDRGDQIAVGRGRDDEIGEREKIAREGQAERGVAGRFEAEGAGDDDGEDHQRPGRDQGLPAAAQLNVPRLPNDPRIGYRHRRSYALARALPCGRTRGRRRAPASARP